MERLTTRDFDHNFCCNCHFSDKVEEWLFFIKIALESCEWCDCANDEAYSGCAFAKWRPLLEGKEGGADVERWDKLAAYEDSGLTPEEVGELLATVKMACEICGQCDCVNNEAYSGCAFAKWKARINGKEGGADNET